MIADGNVTTCGFELPNVMSMPVCTASRQPLSGDYTFLPGTKPPLGLKPRKLVIEERIAEIADAMARYARAGMAIPVEWTDELADLCKTLRERK